MDPSAAHQAPPLERYRPIIPDWEAFSATIGTPEPTSFRVRTGTIPADRLLGALEARGFRCAPVDGIPDFFRVDQGPGSVAQTVEHWLGLLHVQQSVMGLPALALDPRPGERILDLCAAPGGKTVHLAELMEDRGPLVAVDPKEKRIRGLLANVYRLGHPNVLVIAADGRRLPTVARFDRVLVDAPCSAEGTLRKQRGRLMERDEGFVTYVTSLQEALLRRAVALTRPGGLIVYSTCTFAPEENEAIVDRVLRDSPVRLETIPLTAPHAPGLDTWKDRPFHPDMPKAWRVYPHHLDSGGLFMARLRRLPEEGEGTEGGRPDAEGPPDDGIGAVDSGSDEGGTGGRAGEVEGWSPIPLAFPGHPAEDAEERIRSARMELETRFGIPRDVLDGLGWMVRTENMWVHTAGSWPVPGWQDAPGEDGSRWRVVSLGLRALRRTVDGRETPSNSFLSRWGHHLDPERRLELSDEELLRLLGSGEPLPGPFPRGPVALVREGRVLGRGMVGRHGLVSEIPRATASRLRVVLAGHAVPDANDPAASESDSVGTPVARTPPSRA